MQNYLYLVRGLMLKLLLLLDLQTRCRPPRTSLRRRAFLAALRKTMRASSWSTAALSSSSVPCHTPPTGSPMVILAWATDMEEGFVAAARLKIRLIKKI